MPKKKQLKTWENEYPTIKLREPTAEVIIGTLHLKLYEKTFTKKQIQHIRDYFGFEVKNLKE